MSIDEHMLHPVVAEASRAGLALPVTSLTLLDWCELQAWRRYGSRLQLAIEDLLRTQGDAARPETISLQHILIELRRAPFGGNPQAASLTYP